MSECEWCNRGLPIGENGEHYRPQEQGRGKTLLCSTVARRQLAEAQAILKEQESVLFEVGPITCRNGVKHDRIDGCLYCEIERMRPVVEGAKEFMRVDKEGVSYAMWFPYRNALDLALQDYEAKEKP
jgi:hypothetical protein